MKSIQEFLLQLSEQDIRLWLEGNSLRCNAPQDVFTVALHNELVQRKAEIVSFLSQIARASDEMLEGILPAPPNSVLPLSPNQQGIWFVEQLEDNLATYNQAFALDFQGSLNVNVLEQALQEIIHRHAILRTNFIDRNGKPTQAIQELKDVQLSQIDISHLAEAERQSEIEQFTIAGIRRPF
ncbi:MAG: condensation domain-containing protein, partial [Cyanobacteria bacterium P01_D01_bin.56]